MKNIKLKIIYKRHKKIEQHLNIMMDEHTEHTVMENRI